MRQRGLGGKLLPGEIEGAPVDLGAESMLARRPEAVALAREVGLGDRLQPPATSTAAIWTRGALRPMPKGHVMGVPGAARPLAGRPVRRGPRPRSRGTATCPAPRSATTSRVGEYVAARLGREVVDRLVEPLLGGVYAGDAYRISMRAAVPQLFEAASTHGSLLEGVRGHPGEGRRGGSSGGPVFAGIDGGIGTLPLAVADAVRARGGEIRHRDARCSACTRTADGWRVRTDSGAVDADGVVVAVPRRPPPRCSPTSRRPPPPNSPTVEYASMALVTLAFRRADLPRSPTAAASSCRRSTAAPSRPPPSPRHKWGWIEERGPDLFVLRTSVGRYGETAHLDRDDADLVDVSLEDLGAAVGLAAQPVATTVTRWIGGLPQYPVGHLARVARIREAVAELPGLRVCGAAYDGVGIPACVASARRAADEIIATSTLARSTQRDAGE